MGKYEDQIDKKAYEYHTKKYNEEKIDNLQNEIDNLKIELDILKNPVYCEVCGSCGEEGCCSPGKCKTVQGLYCEGNVKSWEEMNIEVDKYYQLKDKLKEYLSCNSCDGQSALKEYNHKHDLKKELQELIDV